MSNAKCHGLCLIINNEDYNNPDENRVGSEKDVQNLKCLFKQLRFKVVLKSNLTKVDMRLTLDEFANDKRHEKAEMSIVIVLAHGDDGMIQCVDGCYVSNMKFAKQAKVKPFLIVIV